MVTLCATHFNTKKLNIFPTECVSGFPMVLHINSDYLSKQHYRIVFVEETRYVSCEMGTEFLNI